MYNKQQIGKIGEDIAAEYLKKQGYSIMERNFRCKQGEIDMIAMDKEEIVFIEVKTRLSLNYGLPSEAVNQQKKRHLMKTIQYYLYQRNLEDHFIRMDVVEIYIRHNKAYINHIKQAIS